MHLTLESVCTKPSTQYGLINCSPSDDTDTLVARGGSCSMQCNVGYKPMNSNGTLYCLPNGSWSHQAECIVITCDTFVAPSSVNVSCNGSAFNSVCTVTCWNGAALAVDFQYICNSTSQWEPIGNEFICNQGTGAGITTDTATTTTTTTTTNTAAITDHSNTHITVTTTTISLSGDTMPTSSSKNSPNGGAIAGGVVAASLFVGLLAVAVVIIWQYRKRLGSTLNLSNTPSISKICYYSSYNLIINKCMYV